MRCCDYKYYKHSSNKRSNRLDSRTEKEDEAKSNHKKHVIWEPKTSFTRRRQSFPYPPPQLGGVGCLVGSFL